MDKKSTPPQYQEYHISREQNANNPTLPGPMLDAMIQLSEIDTTSELAFAVHSKTPASGQPKSYFQVAGMDVLRDDGLIYEEMLKEAGVQTKIDFYPGCVHG